MTTVYAAGLWVPPAEEECQDVLPYFSQPSSCIRHYFPGPKDIWVLLFSLPLDSTLRTVFSKKQVTFEPFGWPRSEVLGFSPCGFNAALLLTVMSKLGIIFNLCLLSEFSYGEGCLLWLKQFLNVKSWLFPLDLGTLDENSSQVLQYTCLHADVIFNFCNCSL